jgi:signal transduction histidine kinase/YesN/AraC family two-component response regulator
MPKTVLILLLAACLISPGQSIGQSATTDSLLALLPNAKDTNRVNLLNQLSAAYWYIDPLKTIDYASQAIELGQKLDFKKGITSGYNNTGIGYYQQNKYEAALQWYNKALGMHKQSGNFSGEGYVLSNMGLIYWKQGAFPKAVEYYLQSLKIWDDHQLEIEKASVFDNLANVYNEQEEFDQALSYYFKARSIQKKFPKSDHEQSMTLSNIGTAYLGKENYSEALKYFLESLTYLAEDEKESRAVSFSNIGLAYIELKDPAKAETYLTNALLLQKEIEDADGMIHTLMGLAKIKQQTGNMKESSGYASQALELAQQINDKAVLAEAWQMLAAVAEKQGDYKNAYTYYINYVNARDSIRNTESIYKIANLQASFETEKKQGEIEALKKEQQQQAFRRNAMAAGLIALLIIAALVVSRQRLKIKQNSQLVNINAELTKQSQQLEEQAKKLKELDQAKSTFFANISHEFRTPLTLILNSLSDRMATVKGFDDKNEQQQLQVMHRNAKRLLNLVNQLLDLSKLEGRQMKLSPANVNLTELLTVTHVSFSSLSSSRDIDFSLSIPGETITCRLDADKIEKILFNLLSNAFKFTPVGGSIQFETEIIDSTIQFTIRDSGRGIPETELAQVFNRFYQGKQYYTDEQGTGIGLALTKELVELHGGKIWAENQTGGACFILQLPLVATNIDEEFASTAASTVHENAEPGIATVAVSGNGKQIANVTRPSILIVEDSADLRNYVKNHLINEFDIIEAENGRKGFEKAIVIIPDLVITDWMMPEMDGITLCHHLKTDERTSHIPVILLTALASDETKFRGLETGADAYLTKPFDNRELQIRIRNLIDSRKLLRERYSRELHLGPQKVQVNSMDEKFLEKVMQAVETYMGDPDFSMEKFGQEVSLSRMQLHRKLKALTGESPGDFLRTMRLQRAKRLLELKAGNVSEIAYEVGFNNLSYFSKCYREQFGIAPNETISSGVTEMTGNVTNLP